MKYIEMTKFLNDNDIMVMQPVVASEVKSQLCKNISEELFEEICEEVYMNYLDKCVESFENFDIPFFVNEELSARGLN